MKITTTLFLSSFMIVAAVSAGESEEQAHFRAYKDTVKQDPALIRFYTFEEGQGDEVANQVSLDPLLTAVTGGPRGSMTLQRYNAYGRHPCFPWKFSPETISLDWTRGRWPWKAGIASGVDKIEYPWEATCLYRSGITGAEFADGGTFSGWLRIPANQAKGRCNILSLFEGRVANPRFTGGFNLSYVNEVLSFSASSTEDKVNGASVYGRVSPGLWHHFAVTFDKAALKLYLDGELKDEKPFGGKLVAVTWKDTPLVGPFHEMGFSFGHFMMLGVIVPKADEIITRFHIDELSIYKRALTAEAVKQQEAAGRPTMTADEQLAADHAQAVEQELLGRIKLDIPKNSGGYFRIQQQIPATVSIPSDVGPCKAVFSLETLSGKPLLKQERAIEPGKSVTENIQPPACGVFYLDLELRGSDGKTLKKQRYCLGIVPPAPKELSVNNPMACWADDAELFHYDSPLRRLFCYPYNVADGSFQKHYDHYDQVIPNFRAYVGFGVDPKFYPEALRVLKGKKIFGLEFTSEPHEPCDTKAYVAALKVADEMFRPAFPGILFFPPGIEPGSLSVLAGILENGGMQYMDGVSYHPYSGQPLRDYLDPDNATQRLKKLLAKHPGKKLTLWNTESGVMSLPRRGNGRPMTGKDAYAAGFSGASYSGVDCFPFFVTLMPEADAAALQCHDVLLKLADGYKMYTVMSGPSDDGADPGLRGVAITALAGQVLNNQVDVTRLPLASVGSFCALIRNTDHTTTAAVFAMESTTENFKVQPNSVYKTMDMLGNFGTVKAGTDGLLSLPCATAPLYVFNVPADLQAVAPLRLVLPSVLPDSNILQGSLTVSNQLASALVGKLVAANIPGASITLTKSKIKLAPGESETIGITLVAEALKRRLYVLDIELRGSADKLISSTRAAFQSSGVIQMIPLATAAVKLDGDEAKWKNISATVCDDADAVVHGKPNTAEIWLPQWRGKDDLSFAVKTLWCKGDGIYFQLKVKDSVVCPAPDDKTDTAWKYDCLELYFDSRECSKQGTLLSDGMDQIIIIPEAGASIAPCKVRYGGEGNNHVDVQCVGRKTADGYLIEGKVIPNAKSFFRIQGGSQFRMDFMLDDADGLDAKQLRKAAMALHGDFGNYRNSDVWGRYELSLDKK